MPLLSPFICPFKHNRVLYLCSCPCCVLLFCLGPKARAWEQEETPNCLACSSAVGYYCFFSSQQQGRIPARPPARPPAAICGASLFRHPSPLRDMAEEFQLGDIRLPSELLDDGFFVGRVEEESVAVSESEEKGDYMAGLTQQMARSFLHDDEPKPLGLSAGGARRPKGDAWDLLHEAAGHRRWSLYERGLLSQRRKPCPGSKTTTPFLAHHQLQAARILHLKQKQLMQQQLAAAAWERQSKARRGAGQGEIRCGRSFGLSPSVWPPHQTQHQPQPGSGMRAVFLRSSGATRKESIGTGVFLPRTAGAKAEPQKKSTCSTVLIPARVVQALHLNLEELGAQARFPGGFVLEHDAFVGRRNSARNHSRPQPAAMATPVASLPQEWTY